MATPPGFSPSTILLAEARSYVARLADTAGSFDAALEYERVLLQLDCLHGGAVPPITVVPTGDRDVLFSVARAAMANLEEHPVDKLELALCLLADFTSASSLLDPVGRHPHLQVSLVPGRVCRFAH